MMLPVLLSIALPICIIAMDKDQAEQAFQQKNKTNLGRAPSIDHSCLTLSLDPDFQPGVHQIQPSSSSSPFKTYCLQDGWTLAMKVNGHEQTFLYDSGFWTNSSVYNSEQVELDNTEAKLESYSAVPFDEVLLIMKTQETLNEVHIGQNAASLKDLIGDGVHHPTDIGRSVWKGLIANSSLQLNCNREGFNTQSDQPYSRVRIGIIGNQENNCVSCDSWLGIGGYGNFCGGPPGNSCGNYAACSPDKGNANIISMGYIFVR